MQGSDRPKLPDNPTHVHMPTEPEMDFAGVTYGRWSRDRCATCGGDGTYLWYDDRGNVVEWDCDHEEQLVLSRWFSVQGIAGSWQRVRQADLTGLSPIAQQWASDYYTNIGANVRRGIGGVLRGQSGSGKTIVCVLMLKAAMELGYSGYYFNVGENLKNLQSKGGWPEDKRVWVEHKIRHADIVLLDDFDQNGGAGEWMRAQAASIITSRSNSSLPTLVTLKRSDEDIASTFGYPVLDLLQNCGRIHEVGLPETWRPKASERNTREKEQGLRRPVVFK